jgi:creatinine amidohydrolase
MKEPPMPNPPTALRLAELTRARCRELAANALLVWPVGATEQHGPHLPVGTDAMHAEWVATRAADLVAERIPVVIAPTLPFGSSAHHLPFGGTMSISTETYYRVLVELTESLVSDGFRRIFIVNGHGGNHELVQLVARDVALRREVTIAAGSWWTIAWDALVKEGAADAGTFPGHSGAFETSLVQAMRPDLVVEPLPHRDELGQVERRRFLGDLRIERHGSWTDMDGWTDSPDRAKPALGAAYLDASIAALASQFLAVHAASESK